MPGEVEFLDDEPFGGDGEPFGADGEPLGGDGEPFGGDGAAAGDTTGADGAVRAELPAGGHAPGRRPPTRHRVGPRRAGRLVGVGCAVLGLGLLLARALTGGGARPSPDAASAATQQVSAVASRSVQHLPAPATGHLSPLLVPDPTAGRIVTESRLCLPSTTIGEMVHSPDLASLTSDRTVTVAGAFACAGVPAATCPEGDDGQIACSVTRTVPPAVSDAVRARYPDARVSFAYTELARQTQLVWYRMIWFSLGTRATLVVTVEQSGNEAGQPLLPVDNVTEQVVSAVSGSRVNVEVEVVAAGGTRVDPRLPVDLVSDPRLTTPA